MNKNAFYILLMKFKPVSAGASLTNSRGQTIEFCADPISPGSTIVAVCHELKLAGHTDHYKYSELKDSENIPVFVDGELKSEHELT